LDATARRILTLYDRTGVLDPACREDGEVDTPRHRAIAKRIATEGMVLLRNEDNVLPLSSKVKLLVTGPGAASVEAGTGSGLVNGGVGNTPIIEGTTEAFGEASLHHVAHSASIEAQDIDEETTILYCAVAHTGREGNDLDEIVLPGDQPDEIRRLGSLNGSLVVVLQTGSAVDVSGWHEATDALLVCWYGGQATGEAVADILVGKTNPSGKLPCTFGNPIDDYPAAALGTWPARLLLDEEPSPPGRTKEDREQICAYAADYTEGTLIGYRWFTARGLTPVYPFGFGLSYTSFEYQEANVRPTADSATSEAAPTRDPATKAGPSDGCHREEAAATDETSDSSDEGGWEVICRVKNTGTRAGDTVVQCYHRPPDSAVGRATAGVRPHELRGFCKVRIEPGESRNVVLHLRPNDLSRYDEVADAWVVSAGDHILRVGSSSTDLPFSLRISIEESTTVDSP
jgi:beta-glucosidase